MSPLFLALVVLLGAIFVYATRRAMRKTSFDLPTPQDAAQELDEATAARTDGTVHTAAGEPARHAPPDASWGRQPAATPRPAPRHLPRQEHVRRPLQTGSAVPGFRRPSRAHAMFGNRAGLHHAVVAMTVLGPCRALDPYTPDRSGPSAHP